MSDTAVQPATAVDQWLASFDEALTAGDAAGAAALFRDDSYWRDLVSFTWNITTVEGRDGATTCSSATLAHTSQRLAHERGATEADGVTEGWFTFETARAAATATCASRTARPGRC